MVELLTKAFEALKTLPPEDRERIAYEILERVEDKSEWDRIISSPAAQDWLAAEAKKALKGYDKVRKNLSMGFMNIEHDNLMRKSAYWAHFDDLPADVRQLAENNYQLWKKNTNHPGLRFKQIHKTLPIFSFRVGMRHRTVGVEADNGKIAWFWIGSFEHFRKAVGGVDTTK